MYLKGKKLRRNLLSKIYKHEFLHQNEKIGSYKVFEKSINHNKY
jgi:hypothetical protein